MRTQNEGSKAKGETMKKRPTCKQYLTHLFQQMRIAMPDKPGEAAKHFHLFMNDVMTEPKIRIYYSTVKGRTYYDMEIPSKDEGFAERLNTVAGHINSAIYLAANPIDNKKTA